MINFLDCTLRDGGYYNSWDFNVSRAKELIGGLNASGCQIIEVGYKSPPSKKKYYGLFKYCNEDYLGFLQKADNSEYCFMIDIKEFICHNDIDEEALNKCIRHADNSVFSWVRLATHFNTVEYIPKFVSYFKEKGYKVGFNLMGGSLLSLEQIKRGVEIGSMDVDVFYIADSFGSFYPEDVKRLIGYIRKHYSGALGIHTHDNQGMAYANTLAAIEEGVTFIDGTVTGMGRGAGNLLTEQFLLGYSNKFNDDRYNASPLLPIISDYFSPMKSEYQWGYSYSYMLSGLKNIHQSYCQSLIEDTRFTSREVSEILEAIPLGQRSKFSKEELNISVLEKLKAEQLIADDNRALFPEFDLTQINSKEIIIVARGESVKNKIDDIIDLANRKKTPLIECNDTGYFSGAIDRFLIILNQLRLNEWLEKSKEIDSVKVVTGVRQGNTSLASINHFSFQINDFDTARQELLIPDYDAGIYAIGLAIKSGCKHIYLAGFDGYKDQEIQSSKEEINKQIRDHAERVGVSISFITPSLYTSFDQKSLYTIE